MHTSGSYTYTYLKPFCVFCIKLHGEIRVFHLFITITGVHLVSFWGSGSGSSSGSGSGTISGSGTVSGSGIVSGSGSGSYSCFMEARWIKAFADDANYLK